MVMVIGTTLAVSNAPISSANVLRLNHTDTSTTADLVPYFHKPAAYLLTSYGVMKKSNRSSSDMMFTAFGQTVPIYFEGANDRTMKEGTNMNVVYNSFSHGLEKIFEFFRMECNISDDCFLYRKMDEQVLNTHFHTLSRSKIHPGYDFAPSFWKETYEKYGVNTVKTAAKNPDIA